MIMPPQTPVPMPMKKSPSMTPQMHRIYDGSPAKIRSPKRVFEMATREGTIVWKARRVSTEGDLQLGEVYITHRRIIDETDCCLALAKIGVSQTVLISEALGILGEDMDEHFHSLSGMAEYKSDTEIIMGSIKSCQGKGTFSRFAYALYNGCKQDGDVYNAIIRSGMSLFWGVMEAAAEDHPDNHSLNLMISSEEAAEFETLKAWSNIFVLLEERHQKSHPFNFIKGEIELAEAALEVLKFLAAEGKEEKCKELSHVIHAAIPLVAKKIAKKKMDAMEVKAQEEIDDDVVRNRQPRRKFLANQL